MRREPKITSALLDQLAMDIVSKGGQSLDEKMPLDAILNVCIVLIILWVLAAAFQGW